MRFFLVVAVVLFTSPAQADPPTESESIRLDDLTAPAANILRAIPGVTDVEAKTAKGTPTHRIVHLLDWHYVPKDDYAADLRAIAEEPLSDAEINRAYLEFLDDVEAVQAEQKTVLRCLIRDHGLSQVYVEGLTEDDLPAFRAKIAGLVEIEANVPRLRRERDGLVSLIEHGPTDDTSEEDRAFIRRIDAFLEHHRREMLQIGAAGQLYLAGELDNLLPLEEPEGYAAANPVAAEGTVRFDAKAIEARQNSQVRRMLDGGPFAVVVLGGGNDLTDNVSNDVQYIRISVESYTAGTHRSRSSRIVDIHYR